MERCTIQDFDQGRHNILIREGVQRNRCYLNLARNRKSFSIQFDTDEFSGNFCENFKGNSVFKNKLNFKIKKINLK